MAIGVLGMRRSDFYDMPVGEFWEAVASRNKEVEADRRHLGELVRGAALRLFNINLKRSDQIKDPRKFWRMPWDEPTRDEMEREDINGMSEEQREASVRNLIKIIGW